MPEFILIGWTFFLLYLFTWPALVLIVLLGLILEANDRYIISVFLAGIMLYVIWSLLAFTFSIPYIWVAFVVYPIIGFVYAPYRWLRYCESQVRKNNELPIATKAEKDRHSSSRAPYGCRNSPEEMASVIDFKRHLERIACWVLAWPLSAIECLIGDLYREIQRIITTFFGRLYRNITERALRLVDFPEIEDTDSGGC